jgi:hypothetical protein
MFRPSEKNLYVIPDIHGNIEMLNLLLEEILPLQTGDRIVFLGDYIDRGIDSHLVIDRLIEVKEQYEDCIFLKGNHEYMMLVAAGLIKKSQDSQDGNFRMWLANGGRDTLRGYLERKGSKRSLDLLNRRDITTIIPADHLSFILNTASLHEEDEFIFVHGGLDPSFIKEIRCMIDDHAEYLSWDRSLYEVVIKNIKSNERNSWKETIITGHNGPNVIINDTFMMLDCGSPRELLVAEMHSRKALKASRGMEFGASSWESSPPIIIDEINLTDTSFREGKVKRI